ncbi:hypothetical protein ACRALDRAFT_213032 [Sodiomyces alcalophilus JCM 7366]|uniref:uncharacterized protein n=1 Tax=Sodiomyces alcalophilus JCM 7366 TaxID=591952 RepID=UPI0039B374D4
MNYLRKLMLSLLRPFRLEHSMPPFLLLAIIGLSFSSPDSFSQDIQEHRSSANTLYISQGTWERSAFPPLNFHLSSSHHCIIPFRYRYHPTTGFFSLHPGGADPPTPLSSRSTYSYTESHVLMFTPSRYMDPRHSSQPSLISGSNLAPPPRALCCIQSTYFVLPPNFDILLPRPRPRRTREPSQSMRSRTAVHHLSTHRTFASLSRFGVLTIPELTSIPISTHATDPSSRTPSSLHLPFNRLPSFIQLDFIPRPSYPFDRTRTRNRFRDDSRAVG